MTFTLHIGRRCPRPPITRDADDVVEVLRPDNTRAKERVGDLTPGLVLFGLGVIARIEAAVA